MPETTLRPPATLYERVRAILMQDDNGDGYSSRCGERPIGPDGDHMLPVRPRDDDSFGLSEFELDLRDWGMAYGIAFGLARTEDPTETTESVAARALEAALPAFREWSGEFAPRVDALPVARAVVRASRDVTLYDPRDPKMERLSNALIDLSRAIGH